MLRLPLLRVAWMHEFNRDRSITGSLVSVPGTLFGVDGARAWSDALKVNAGSRLALVQIAKNVRFAPLRNRNNSTRASVRQVVVLSWSVVDSQRLGRQGVRSE
jgi:hypothetical protein